MWTMSAPKSLCTCVADGTFTRMFSIFVMSRLTIMKEARRKNMTSISGMISIRACLR